jgi:hypothetical protein
MLKLDRQPIARAREHAGWRELLMCRLAAHGAKAQTIPLG